MPLTLNNLVLSDNVLQQNRLGLCDESVGKVERALKQALVLAHQQALNRKAHQLSEDLLVIEEASRPWVRRYQIKQENVTIVAELFEFFDVLKCRDHKQKIANDLSEIRVRLLCRIVIFALLEQLGKHGDVIIPYSVRL